MQTSMREANDRGFDSLLVTDATESYFPQFKAAAVEMITAQVGALATVSHFLDAVPCVWCGPGTMCAVHACQLWPTPYDAGRHCGLDIHQQPGRGCPVSLREGVMMA